MPDPDANQPRKRRGRRRSNRDKPKGKPPAPETSDASEQKPTTPQAESKQSGYTNAEKTPAGDRPAKRKRRRNKSGGSSGGEEKSASDQSRPPRDSSGSKQSHEKSNTQPGSDNQGGGGRKRRKVRTKTCFHCYTPCVSLFRVQVDHTNRWRFVCDICWAYVADDNPHYKFGGIWPPSRGQGPKSKGGKHKGGSSDDSSSDSSTPQSADRGKPDSTEVAASG